MVRSVGLQPLLRPSDDDALGQAIRQVRRDAGVHLAFGGRVQDNVLRLSEFAGVRSRRLHGMRIEPGRGLGGYVVARGRAHAVPDYPRATGITHDYDSTTAGEGIRSVIAAPVSVTGSVRGVLFVGFRDIRRVDDRVADILLDRARRLALEIAVRDEVDRRVRLLRAESRLAEQIPPAQAEQLRAVHAELLAIAGELPVPALGERLRRAGDRLSATYDPDAPPEAVAAPAPPLSAREVDVLAHVALGCRNAEIGERLSLAPETVKAYLRSASRKLDAHGRQQAVALARRHGLLP